MNTEEYVKQSREKQREAFGYREIKKDCTHYGENGRKTECKILTNVGNKMPCEVGVCHFYERK